MYHEDLPSNDFHPLMAILAKQGPSAYAYAGSRVAAYPAYLATSYYARLLPDASTHLAFACTTLHWLSAKPVPVPDAVFAANSRDPGVLRAWSQQAHNDLRTFLCLRAQEMVPGGSLVIFFPSTPSPPSPPPHPSALSASPPPPSPPSATTCPPPPCDDSPPSPAPVTPWSIGPLELAVRELQGEGCLSPEDVVSLNSHRYLRRPDEVVGVLEDSQVVADWSVRHYSVRGGRGGGHSP